MTKTKIMCNSCREIKKEYYPGAGICEDCAKKIDEHIEGGGEDERRKVFDSNQIMFMLLDDELNNGGKS